MTGNEQTTVNGLAERTNGLITRFDTFFREDWKPFRDETLDSLKDLRDDKIKRDAISQAAKEALVTQGNEVRSRRSMTFALAGALIGAIGTVIAAVLTHL